MRAPDCAIPRHDTGAFTWQGTHGCAEASDFGDRMVADRVWLDAADVGMLIRNPRTGREVLFVLAEEERDREGDTVAWLYRAADASGLTVRIYND